MWHISIDSRERWREVDGRVRGGLDELDVLSRTAAYECVHGKLELHGVDDAFELFDQVSMPLLVPNTT